MPLRWRREIGGPSHGAHHCTHVPLPRIGPVVTTIRVTRRTPVPPEPIDGTAAQAPGGPPEDPAIRLEVTDPPASRTTLDGAWWPRTRDLSHELPDLVEELHRRGIRVTRVGYHPAAWKPAARRLEADGRTIRLGWFRSQDPALLNLSGDLDRRRLDLLVIPPDSTAEDAQQAFAAAGDRANQQEPTALLETLGVAGPAVERPAAVHG